MPALLTRISNGSAAATDLCAASTSVTSSASVSAFWPRSRSAAAASSISDLVRAAMVTCAPASAKADAAASPMPRPPPVTSARLPSRRKDGVLVRSTFGTSLRRLTVGDVTAAVAADADIGLFGMRDETFEHAQPRVVFADHGARRVGEHFLVGAGLQEFSDPQSSGIARRLLGRQRVIRADHLVAIGDIGARPKEQRAVILHVVEEIIRIARHHLHVFRGNAVGLAHNFG